ncbi:MAG TPA: ABC transporter ATP-binding protein [Candidatus Dormibacteraeota bacterium]|nr:ABC transporter ATP-binding protein [Candidatus Dormibacteraeota bacterium]
MPRATTAPYLARYARPLAIAGGLGIAGTLIDLARPWPLLLVVDNAIGRRPLGQPWAPLLAPATGDAGRLAAVAGVLLVGLATAGAVVGYLGTYLSDGGAERVGADLRADLHRRLLGLSLAFHQRQRTGDLTTRLTGDVGRVQDALVAWLTNLVPQALTLAGMAIVLWVIDPPLALASLLVVPPLGLVIADRRRRLRAAQRDYRDRQGDLAAGATETMRNVGLVQALGWEPHAQRVFEGRNAAMTRAGLEVSDLNARYEPSADVVLAGGTALVLWVGAGQVLDGRMTVGLLVVALSYVAGLYLPIRSLTRLTSILGKGAASRDRLAEVLASGEALPDPPGAPAMPAPRREIALRGVSFAYPSGPPVLRELDLRIPAGSMVCVVGAMGAGKSTLLSLLVRLHDPTGGRIEVDGVPLASFGLRSVRARMAVVPQEPAIFDGSLLENVALGRPDAARADLLEAAHLALLDDVAARLPGGYDAPVGEGGGMLSGGQRRCVAMARALVRDAAVLLLDEPTSGLDLESERRVLDVIERAARSRTVVVVTHRLALSERADVVAVLAEGRIVEAGAPGDLRRRDGHYAALHMAGDRPHSSLERR